MLDPGLVRAVTGTARRRWRPAALILAAFVAVLLMQVSLLTPEPALADPASPLAVTKSDSPDPVASGDELTYTITVTNTGGAKVDNVALSDQVNHLAGIGTPPLLVLTSTKGSCTQSSFQTYYQVECSAGSLAGGESWTVTIRGVVTAPDGTTINNTVAVSGTKSAQNFNSQATSTTLVQNTPSSPLPDLTITKAGPTSVGTGVTMEPLYTLTVNNIGGSHATDITVVDTVPAGITGISAAGNSLFDCSVAGQTVTCTGGRVNAGSNATIVINGTTPNTQETITNTAVVDPNDTIEESNELNNTSASVTTTVTSTPEQPPLTIDKTDDPDPVTPGSTLTYTILVTNTGAGPQSRANDVVVVDGTQGLDASSISAVVTPNGVPGACTVNAPQVTCSPSSPGRRLNGGESMEIVIEGQVLAAAGTTLINTATVTGNIKNTGVSASATETTEVKPGIDLTVTAYDSPDPVCASSWPTPNRLANPPDGLAAAGGTIPTLLADPVCLQESLTGIDGGFAYTFIVGNSGIEPATDVTLRDPLPDGLIFDSYDTDAGFTCAVDASNVVTCTGGTIPPESTREVRFLMVAPPSTGMITNTVTIDPNNAIFEADETNNTFSVMTTVQTGIDLVIVKDDNPAADPPGAGNPTEGFDPIATSGTQTYTITIDNVGPQDATNIEVLDILPADTIFLGTEEDHGFTCTYNIVPHTVRCTGGSLPGTKREFYDPAGPDGPGLGFDDVATIKIRVFAQPYIGTMINEVRVDPDNTIAEVNEDNNIDFESTTVQHGDGTIGAFNELSITKMDAPDPVATSSIVTYTIVVTNNGTDPAVNVAVRDFLPSGFNYIEAADTAPGANAFLCTEAGNVVNCNGATIEGGGGSRTIQITAFSSSVPGTYTNQALVDPDGAIPEGNETNNAASATTQVVVGAGYIDLRVTKCDDPACDPAAPAVVDVLGTINYTLEVRNDGTNPAFDVVVRDVLPAGVTFVSASDQTGGDGSFICSEAGGIVNCTGGTLDGTENFIPGVPNVRTILVTVKAPNANGVVLNQARIDPDNQIPESNETNNSSSESTTVQSFVNLTLDKDGPNQAQQNQEETYTIRVKNLATPGTPGRAVSNVKVLDTLPVGLIPLTWTATGNFTCQIFQNPVNVVECTGDMAVDEEVTITIRVFITQLGGTLDNEACVDPDNVIVESNEADNCDTKVTPVKKAAPNLSVNKSASAGTVSPGQTLTYTVTVSNVGDANAAEPVTITDTLPEEVTFVSAVATNGFTCTFAAPTVTCSDPADGDTIGLAAGASTTITIEVTVNTDASTPFTNTASVPAANFDPNTAPCTTPDACENETVLGNNSASVTTSVAGASIDLIVTGLTDNPDPVNVGQSLEYTFFVTNGGTSTANGVVIEAVMDDTTGLDFVGAAGSEGFLCGTLVGNTVTCTGNLIAGATTEIKVVFHVNAAAPATHTLDVTVDPDNLITESSETNNTASETTTVSASLCSSCIDLVMGSILDTPDPASPGDTLTYVVTASNAGDTSTLSVGTDLVVVQILLPAGVDHVSTVASAGFTCAAPVDLFGLESVECTGDLDAGEGVVITIETTVDGTEVGGDGDIFVTAVIDPADVFPEGAGAGTEFTNANNQATEGTFIDVP